jgi:hypothetical protein
LILRSIGYADCRQQDQKTLERALKYSALPCSCVCFASAVAASGLLVVQTMQTMQTQAAAHPLKKQDIFKVVDKALNAA